MFFSWFLKFRALFLVSAFFYTLDPLKFFFHLQAFNMTCIEVKKPRVVGHYLGTPIFYTSIALNVLFNREKELHLNCEPGWISFSVSPGKFETVALFKIRWKQ